MPSPQFIENDPLHLSLLRIHCFGVFRAVRPGETEAVGIVSKHKMWSLFKYLINHKGKAICTQEIMNLFWPENENPDDTATLRTTVSRLKALLEPKSASYQKSSYLIYSKDACTFNINAPFWLDTDEFERLCGAAHKLGSAQNIGDAQFKGESKRKMAIDLYFQALDLYGGEFLAEDLDYEWMTVPREHYRRLYLESVRELANWLLEMEDFTQALELLHKALKFEPYAEELQILLMKAWIGTGDLPAAASHYSECSRRLYNELGIKPSAEWKTLYRQLKEIQGTSAYHLILESSVNLMVLDPGPMICDPEFFWGFLLYERRRVSRNKGESTLVILELLTIKENTLRIRDNSLERLKRAVGRKLRKCDLVCRLDDQHLALLLQDTGAEGSQTVIAQINEYFSKRPENSGLILQIKLNQIKD